MSKAPYFQFYPSDFLGDTMHLTGAEVGAYILLLCAMWNAGGGLPNDPMRLAQMARCTPRKWPGMWAALAPFFEATDTEITHKRLTEQAVKVRKISGVRSEAAKSGVEAKALKNKDPASANATANAEQVLEQNASNSTCTRARSNTRSQILEGVRDKSLPPSELALEGASAPDQVEVAMEAYNQAAGKLGLPLARSLTDSRRKHLKARLKEHGQEGWTLALRNLASAPHLLGRNDRGWKADLDFLLRPDKLLRVIEGGYSSGGGRPGPGGGREDLDWI